MSAVASATTGGTTVTGIPRLVASATSILSGVIDIEQTARSFGLAASTARSMRSCRSENRTSHFLTAAISFDFAMILLESVLILTFAIARRRSSALDAIGCVTNCYATDCVQSAGPSACDRECQNQHGFKQNHRKVETDRSGQEMRCPVLASARPHRSCRARS